MISQTMNLLRSKLDRPLVAQPFSSLSAHKSIKHHEKIGKVLGIDNPFFRSADGIKGRKTIIDGKPVLNFAWCDYLGLAGHPELIKAAKDAIDDFGACISASRMVAGEIPLHRTLEEEITQFCGTEDALLLRLRARGQRLDHRHDHERWRSRRARRVRAQQRRRRHPAFRCDEPQGFRHNNLDSMREDPARAPRQLPELP